MARACVRMPRSWQHPKPDVRRTNIRTEYSVLPVQSRNLEGPCGRQTPVPVSTTPSKCWFKRVALLSAVKKAHIELARDMTILEQKLSPLALSGMVTVDYNFIAQSLTPTIFTLSAACMELFPSFQPCGIHIYTLLGTKLSAHTRYKLTSVFGPSLFNCYLEPFVLSPEERPSMV